MARKPNYGFEKRKREQDRKTKQEEKRQRRLDDAKRRVEDPPALPPGEKAADPSN